MIKYGIEYDCSVFPANRAHGGLVNFEEDTPCIVDYKGMVIKEFPINTAKLFSKRMIFSGGGYFRLFPYSFIKTVSRDKNYIMTYFHPRDFDTKQPMIPELGIVRKFKSYYGIKECENKLRKWLRDYEFIDLRTADRQINWKQASVVNLN